MVRLSANPLGLIAGEGVFPLLVARGAHAAGRRVVCAAFRGSAWTQLRNECDRFRWVSVARPGSWIRYLRSAGCSEAIMVGRVAHQRLHDRWMYLRYIPDLRAVRLWLTRVRRDTRPYAVLGALMDELGSAGITVVDSTQYCREHLAAAGVMTRRQPTDLQRQDMLYGWQLAQSISRMDIGQCLVVMRRQVVAVEALEGTAALIQRAGSLCKTRGWTLVKVSNTTGDVRVDVPTIGTATIEALHACGGGCIALEAGKTLMLEKPKVLELADRYKIAIVGLDAALSPT